MLVLLDHYGYDLFDRDRANFGDLGVRCFFVISGFLITTLLLKESARSGTIGLARFYFRRTLRIFPPFYFYLAAMLLVSAFGISDLSWRGAMPALTYTSNYWGTSPFSYVTSHTWSLATEEQFYLVWPFLLLMIGRRRAPWLLGVIVLASPILRAYVYQHSGHSVNAVSLFHLNADHIGTGCLLAFLREPLQRSAVYVRIQRSRLLAILPVLIVWASAQGNHPSLYTTVLRSAINLSIALCIDWAVTNHTGTVGKVLNTPPVKYIGVLSYSLYLWQQPFSHLHRQAPTLILSPGWRFLANPGFSIPALFACACFSYYVVERPALRLRERLERRELVPPTRTLAAAAGR